MFTAHYILDARTATAHFPGIGRYARNLATAMVDLLTEHEELVILWNAADPSAWNPTPLANPQVKVVAAPISPFSFRQQWMMPALLRRTADGRRQTADGGQQTSIDAKPNTQYPISNTASQSPVPSPQSLAPSLYHSTYYLMPYRPGAPTILTLYDLIAMLHPQTVSARARWLFRVTTWLALRTADRVIAISEATRQDLLSHFPIAAERVTAIPLAADLRFQPQSPNMVESVRRKYNLPDQYLFYLGINKPHKNLVRLIDAYARLFPVPSPPSPVPNLLIAGAWDNRYPEAKQRAEELNLGDRVRFLGPVDDADLPALYSGCTLFVFPSLYEGFGLPVLEAMACGAPVACSDASSLPEVAGDAALLFDPLDVDAIAAALQRGIEDADLRRSLAEQSLARAAHFSWARTAAETLEIYRQMR
jgi:alpha-1,3-rhamnosyl/mannosyltransferase